MTASPLPSKPLLPQYTQNADGRAEYRFPKSQWSRERAICHLELRWSSHPHCDKIGEFVLDYVPDENDWVWVQKQQTEELLKKWAEGGELWGAWGANTG